MGISHSKTPPGYKRGKVAKEGGKSRTVFKFKGKKAKITQAYHMMNVREIEWYGPLHYVQKHIDSGNDCYVKLDMFSAFDSVRLIELWPFLGELNIAMHLFQKDAMYFFHHRDDLGGLIQGAPASPYLFNAYCMLSGLDDALEAYVRVQNRFLGRNYVITRYADDIVLSSNERIGRTVAPAIGKILHRFGFVVNFNKVQRRDTSKTPIEILGTRVFKGRVRAKNRAFQKMNSGLLNEKSMKGLQEWCRQVEKLNKD